MDTIDWLPFVKAAIERNPVSFKELENLRIVEIYNLLQQMAHVSIYDGKRLAMPDEVWNYRRGDGIEKAFLFACNIIERDKDACITLIIDKENVELIYSGNNYRFSSSKGLKKQISIKGYEYQIF